MININVFSEEKAWSQRLKNKEFFFKKICNAFPQKYKFKNKKINLSLMLSNNKKIKILNKKFRKKNKSTDVLSFPSSLKLKILKETYLGDIIISYNYMDDLKSKNLKIFKENVIKTFIHGFLHLLGRDHIKDKDHRKMLSEEKIILKTVISKIT